MTKELQEAIAAAYRAGEEVLRLYEKDLEVQEKSDASPVTAADLASQQSILESLQGFPYPFLSEELADDRSRLEQERVWILDPLDGTQDFLAKTGEFSIMIALAVCGEPQLGVVYFPVGGVLYAAENGKGAFQERGGTRNQLQARSCSSLAEAVAVMSRHHFSDKEKNVLERMGVANVQRVGSTGIKLSKIAAGQADLSFNLSGYTGQWDLAAPECILQEAGGQVTDTKGGRFLYNREETKNTAGFVASNGFLHPQILRALGSS